MSSYRRPLTLRLLLPFIAAVVVASPLAAQTEEVPVVELEPAEVQPPIVEVEPAPAQPVTLRPSQPLPEAAGTAGSTQPSEPASGRSSAAPSLSNDVSSSASLPPLLTGPAAVTPPATASLPDIDGPVAVVPNASGTPIVLQPPVIEPPEVIDDPWTLGRAIPWLIAGLLIGGSLVVLFLQRHRRRIVTRRVEGASVRPTETGPLPTTVVELGSAEPPTSSSAGPNVLVRKSGRSSGA